jgi:hypothetical protein
MMMMVVVVVVVVGRLANSLLRYVSAFVLLTLRFIHFGYALVIVFVGLYVCTFSCVAVSNHVLQANLGSPAWLNTCDSNLSHTHSTSIQQL